MSKRDIGRSCRAEKLAVVLNRLVQFTAKRWLLIVNSALFVQAVLPSVPPVLMITGHASVARLLYTMFRPLCHQLPERSFFLFGPQFAYRFDELQRLVGLDVALRYIGDPVIGYKMAVCQRDAATFAALSLSGLVFAALRRSTTPLSLKAFFLVSAPMAIDGLGQLLRLWESTWWSRVITGGLFGTACVWLTFPYIAVGMRDVLRAASPASPGR
jgi:uncharacterized membrane protein